jgi:uncharacterized protein (DUF2147 family)
MRPLSALRFEIRPAAFICAVLLGVGTAGAQSPPSSVSSARYWQRSNGSAIFDVEPCVDSSRAGREPRATLCGYLVWARDGVVGQDIRNSDPDLRVHALCNAIVMGGFTADGVNAWTGGWVYNWKSGKRYGARFKFTSDSTAELRVRWGLIHRTETLRATVLADPCRPTRAR